MAVDPRHIVGGILTFTMFFMLGNMIKREHLDPPKGVQKLESNGISIEDDVNHGKTTSKENQLMMQPCWKIPTSKNAEQTGGYITFSLTNGPEFYVSQVADAVVIARYLGATLVIPDIRGTKLGDARKFEEIYDIDKFISSLDGVVEVVRENPDDLNGKLAVVKVPNRVSEAFITQKIKPLFREKGNLRIASYFPSINMRKKDRPSDIDSLACLGMFGTLELQSEVHSVVESMIKRLKKLSQKSNGQFIAVDLRYNDEMDQGCKVGSGGRSCHTAQEVAKFLRKIGFDKDTTIYVTQSTWDDRLDDLKDTFPKTYTKEIILPEKKKAKFLKSGNSILENVLDFYLCSKSEVFVPAISSLFYANVAGSRIASGHYKILVPNHDSSSPHLLDYLSPYISKQTHMAYSCFCH